MAATKTKKGGAWFAVLTALLFAMVIMGYGACSGDEDADKGGRDMQGPGAFEDLDEEFDFDETEIENNGQDFLFPYSAERHPSSYIKSVAQMDEYINQVKADFFDTFSFVNHEELQKIWGSDKEPQAALMRNKYDDEFFQHTNLVVIFLGTSSISIKCKVKKVGIKNNELYIGVHKTIPTGVDLPAMPGYYSFVIPLKKSSFNGDTVKIDIREVYLKAKR